MRLNSWLIVLVILILEVGCSPGLKPFTVSMQDEYRWSEEDLKHIQFYLSDDIILRRDLVRGESAIEGGKISIREGRRVEEIIIESGTPGVLIFMPKANRLAISFERDNDRFLIFGPRSEGNGKYVLMASDWDRWDGEVSYDGKLYRTPSKSAIATLLVDLELMRKTEVKRRKAKGRTI